jgi:hypothetical protein
LNRIEKPDRPVGLWQKGIWHALGAVFFVLLVPCDLIFAQAERNFQIHGAGLPFGGHLGRKANRVLEHEF